LFSHNFACKVTKSKAQNKETYFFFCRDKIISPSLMEKLQKNNVNVLEFGKKFVYLQPEVIKTITKNQA
jgi:hypothetical protein